MGQQGMNPVLLDTNIFAHFFIGHVATLEEIQRIGEDNVLVPSTVWMEVLKGSGDRKAQEIVEKRMSRYTIVHIDQQISVKAIQLIREYHLSHDLRLPDALIAATALVLDIELFTYNLKDFRFLPGIKLHELTRQG